MRLIKYRDRGLVIPAHFCVAGKYRLQVYRPDGRCRHDTGWFDNLITDQGLDFMGSGGYLTACQVGSSSAAPAAGNTGLGSFVAGTSNVEEITQAAQGAAPYFGTTTYRYRFAAGEAAGNLSEVGVGTATTGSTLFSRSLITDAGGTPTSITVLADEFLDVTYQIQGIAPTADSSFNIVDSGPAGTTHAVVLRAAQVTSSGATKGWVTTGNATTLAVSFAGSDQNAPTAYDGTIGAVTDSPSGALASVGGSTRAYVGSSLERIADIVWSLGDANFTTGVSAIKVPFTNLGGTWQMSFAPAVPKTSSDTLTIAFKTSWTRTTAL